MAPGAMLSCSVAVVGGVWCAIVPNPLIIATSQDFCSYSELFDNRKIVPRSVRSTSPATVFGSLRLDGCSFHRHHRPASTVPRLLPCCFRAVAQVPCPLSIAICVYILSFDLITISFASSKIVRCSFTWKIRLFSI